MIKTQADDVDRRAAPFNGNFNAIDEAHPGGLSHGTRLIQPAEIVVIGQRPEVDTIPRGTFGHHPRRQQTIGNRGMAMKIEVGWGHGAD